ncbi:MAG: c-type cytochrome, partial [Candidatus Sericytochromatia bacterium]|nr:c-type cytochrome [Candidatus Sericytochromatia bacterium]
FIYSCTPTQLNTAVENKTNEKNKVNTVVFTPQPIASISVQNNTPITVISPNASVTNPTFIPIPSHDLQNTAQPLPITNTTPISPAVTVISKPNPAPTTSNTYYENYLKNNPFPSHGGNDPYVALRENDRQTNFSVSGLDEKEALGKRIFFDTNLSEPKGQSCATCHDPLHSFTTSSSKMVGGITPGVKILNGVTFAGKRNTPTAMYLATDPDFSFGKPIDASPNDESDYSGGTFYDGRAKNLEEQALMPLLANAEMNMPSKTEVILRIQNSIYAPKFRAMFGNDIFSHIDDAYTKLGQAIGAYERSKELNPFTSKYDYFKKGTVTLTAQELRGFELYKSEKKANCASCHVLEVNNNPAVFTDFSYDNLGVPKNTNNPFYNMPTVLNPDGTSFLDPGLGGNIIEIAQKGRFKVPTLRNSSKTAPYMHNGVFNTLKEVVRFYNSACTPGNPDNWPVAEFDTGRNCTEIGNQGLTNQEMDDVVVFLGTLDDGYKP